MRKKKNNKGFTLVEVIIAVVILGIVFAPLLQNFIQAARINQKSRVELDATTMGQNIMEGLSAYDADSIIKAFDTYEAGKPLAVLPSGMAYGSYGEIGSDPTNPLNSTYTVTASGISGTPKYTRLSKVEETQPDGSVVVTKYEATQIVKQTDHKYAFFVTDVEGAKNTKYDLRVTLDASAQYKVNASDPDRYNDVSTASLANINGTYDCVWLDTLEERENTIKKLKQNNTNPGFDELKVASELQRNLNVRIYDANASDPTKAEDYVVEFTDSYGTWNFGSVTSTTPKFSSAHTGQSPRNIYIYYWPNYTTNDACKDKITIDNEAGIKVDIYLVRMKVIAGAFTSETTASNENNYKMDLTIKGKCNLVDVSNTAHSFSEYTTDASYEELKDLAMNIHTNVYENVYYSHDENSAAGGDRLYKKQRGNPTYWEWKDKNGASPSEQQLNQLVNSLAGDKKLERIFDVTVEVFGEGAANNGFKQEERLAIFTGGTTK